MEVREGKEEQEDDGDAERAELFSADDVLPNFMHGRWEGILLLICIHTLAHKRFTSSLHFIHYPLSSFFLSHVHTTSLMHVFFTFFYPNIFARIGCNHAHCIDIYFPTFYPFYLYINVALSLIIHNRL